MNRIVFSVEITLVEHEITNQNMHFASYIFINNAYVCSSIIAVRMPRVGAWVGSFVVFCGLTN